MTDEQIIEILRQEAPQLTAVALADRLAVLRGGQLSAGVLLMYLRWAFPAIPLPVLLDAQSWRRWNKRGLDDDWFNAHLAPWLGKSQP